MTHGFIKNETHIYIPRLVCPISGLSGLCPALPPMEGLACTRISATSSLVALTRVANRTGTNVPEIVSSVISGTNVPEIASGAEINP